MNTRKSAVVLGYGSIGRRHALALDRLGTPLIIVEVKDSTRAQAATDYPSAVVVDDLDTLTRSENVDWRNAVAVIATWGPAHAWQFARLADKGVRRILCEKPLASSVWSADQMCARAIHDSIRLSVNHYVRYSGLATALEQFAKHHELGQPVSAVVAGGAACLVTNGIHWIDLVSRLFQAEPEEVYSTAHGDRINPRSADLGFYGGSAIWSYPGNREAIFSLSNQSSIAARCRIYYRNATVEFHDDLRTVIMRRDMASVHKFPAVTRTGPASELLRDGLMPDVREFMDCMGAAVKELVEGENDLQSPGEIGHSALSAVIGALISGRERRPVRLPIDPESPWGREEWPIS